MIIDSSAILAILFREDDAYIFAEAIATNWPRRMSVSGMLEISMVYESRIRSSVHNKVDQFITEMSIKLMPVTVEQAFVAREAWRLFAKGRHPVALNFGDCFAYALSKVTGEPLLFKGENFLKTDVERVLPTFHYKTNI